MERPDDCGRQGGGTRNRTRGHSREERNNGKDCEVVTVEEHWPCCADNRTDITTCPNTPKCVVSGNRLRGLLFITSAPRGKGFHSKRDNSTDKLSECYDKSVTRGEEGGQKCQIKASRNKWKLH